MQKELVHIKRTKKNLTSKGWICQVLFKNATKSWASGMKEKRLRCLPVGKSFMLFTAGKKCNLSEPCLFPSKLDKLSASALMGVPGCVGPDRLQAAFWKSLIKLELPLKLK